MDGKAPSEQDLEKLRYPTGRFEPPRGELSAEARRALIDEIAALPSRLRAAVAGLPEGGLDTSYRPGGWTARQVIHHLPDSHVNAYVRFKLAATESEPTITTYDEAAWAELPDGRGEDIAGSLLLLESLHRRWVHFLEDRSPEDFRRTLRHPEMGVMTLEVLLALYAWHGRHHLAHVARLGQGEAG